jgi:hypothetical protein
MDDRTNAERYEEHRDRWIEREWGYDREDDMSGPAECSVCGLPLVWAGSRFAHSAPVLPRPRGDIHSAQYIADQTVAGFDLGKWMLTVSSHEPVLRG